jgi:hypothetical protein
METTSVLLANEPRAYRETIAMALRLLRPHIEVIVIDPETLDEMVVQNRPKFVVCSFLTSAVEKYVPSWVVLYPEGGLVTTVSAHGERMTVGELDLHGIIHLIDKTEHGPEEIVD